MPMGMPMGFGMMGFPIFMGLWFVIGIVVFIIVLIDILRRDDLYALEKILWILVVWFLGIIGAIIYYLLSKRNSKRGGDNNGKDTGSN
jgi:prolipoprotein diacylglyceryltransferase